MNQPHQEIQSIFQTNPIASLPFLQIATKKSEKVKLIPNRPQRYFLRAYRQHKKLIVLKARQMGISTIVQGLYFNETAANSNVNSVIVSHEKEATSRMLARTNNFYLWLRETLPVDLIPDIGGGGRQSAEQIYFQELNSRLFIGTAGSSSFGRGDTIQNLHFSEYSSYKGNNVLELVRGLQGAVPTMGREVIESTPRGIGNIFHSEWTDPDSVYHKVFLPWYLMEEYDYTEDVLKMLSEGRVPYPQLSNLTSEEKDLVRKAKYNYDISLTYGQIAFRRYQRFKLKEFFYQEYPEDDVTCFLIAESNIFDALALKKLIDTIEDKPKDTMLDGKLTIWKDVQFGHSYVIGADCSEGDINSDYGCAGILDVNTNEQVGCLHGRFPDYVFAGILAQLGRLYNNALIAPERNNHGHSVINSLVNAEHYTNIYKHEDDKLGWLTSSKTKPLMITGAGGLKEALEMNYMVVHDLPFLGECMAYEYKSSLKGGGMGAREGTHDDKVMAWAIAWVCRIKGMMVRDSSGNPVMIV